MSLNQKVPWDDKYKVGIKEIDAQHKKLFDIVNKLFDLDDDNYTKEDVKNILYEFNDYTKTHFKDEEAYMASMGFEHLEHHKRLHNDIIDALAKIIRTSEKLSVLKSKMRVMAKRILVNHIVKEDIKMSLFKSK